jgi:hypothetical protein
MRTDTASTKTNAHTHMERRSSKVPIIIMGNIPVEVTMIIDLLICSLFMNLFH